MKRRFVVGLLGSVIASVGLLVIAGVVGAQGKDISAPQMMTIAALASTPVSSTFTYQGQLKQGSTPVSGPCDFQFGLWDAASVGAQIGITQTLSAINVTNGLFTVSIDFGANAVTGDARWLAIAARCPAGSGSYAMLNPLQAVTPAPMALALPGLYTQPNATSPNIIGGYSGNVISPTVVGGTIDGGGLVNGENKVWDDYGAIGGGNLNTVSGNAATIGGGSGNLASSTAATVGGGQANIASAAQAAVGGGIANNAGAPHATIGGGYLNIAAGLNATVPGGALNTAQGEASLAAGTRAKALHNGTFVWADWTAADFASTGNNQFLIRASGGVGINTTTPTRTLDVNGVVGVFDGGTRTYYGGLATEGGGQLLDLGINDDATNRFGGTYTTTAQGGLFRVDARAGYDLFQFYGRPVGTTILRQVMSLNSDGLLAVYGLGSGGAAPLCLNASNQISACSSSVRYKDNIANLNLGLETVAQLRPVTFNWKTNGASDLGFVAEEVNQVSPLLTTLNKDGQIEGVKYDRLSAVLVKAVQQQQQQIADLQTQNAAQQQELAQLKRGAAPDQPFNLFNLISVLALGGVIVIGLRQKRGGQA